MNKSLAPVACVAFFACAVAHADVTIQDQTTLNFAIIKAHGTSTNRITDDKKRTESEFTCDGFMSMLCGKNATLEIIRLDQSVTKNGDAKKKTYTEVPLPTPEQRQAMQQHMQAMIEKMKSCPTPPTPVTPNTPSVDTSKCEMTPPTTSVVNPGDTASFAGHAAHHSVLTMTQSCANKDTGDSCDMAYTFDLWLANDDLPELATRQTFDKNYAQKLGLGQPGGVALPPQINQFLAPYKDAMQKLGKESSSLKGYPLKTTFRFAIGGPRCASSKGGDASQGASSGGSSGGLVADASGAAAGAAASSTQGAAETQAVESASHSAGNGVAGSIAGSAAGAFASKMMGGLFSKKKQPDAAPPKDATAAAAAAPPGLVTVAEFSVETTAIASGAIPADQFEMPAGWKKIVPQEKEMTEPTCPKTGA
jgi:hypothetical protein